MISPSRDTIALKIATTSPEQGCSESGTRRVGLAADKVPSLRREVVMPIKATPADGQSLGQYLDDGRRRAGYSLRTLAAITGYPMSRINRLLKDEVDRPSPATLVHLADALQLSTCRLFGLAGHPYPDLDDVLRGEYRLPDEAIARIHDIINDYAAPEGNS
jgi:transcriptional regulator with XRE-family HTH domain